MTSDMENWFLRGGKRPEENGMQETLPEPPDEISLDGDDEDVVSCPHCGGENLAAEEYCTHCGLPLHGDDEDDEDDEDEREFVVTVRRTRTIRQEAKIKVLALCKDTAMMKAEDAAEDEADDWSWKDIPGSEEYEDCEAVEAEEG